MKNGNLTYVLEHILFRCGSLDAGEKLGIIYDVKTKEVADLFVNYALSKGLYVTGVEIPYVPMHGVGPPKDAVECMMASDLIMGMTYSSMAHTLARKRACENGSRYLSMPEYSVNLLSDPSIMVDYRKRSPIVKKVADKLTDADFVDVKSDKGTNIRLDVRRRIGNYCPGFVSQPGDLGSPPDIEANIAPVEGGSSGVIIVDGSIPCAHIGLLSDPVALYIENGMVINVLSENKRIENIVTQILSDVNSFDAYNVAELGIGLNEMCKLTGNMLTDEGTNGTVHFGLGSNITIGGKTDVGFHLDFVIEEPTMIVDGVIMIEKGSLKL